MALEGDAIVNGHDLNSDNMVVLEPGISRLKWNFRKVLVCCLIGGEPFESPIYCGGTLWDVPKRN